MTKREPGGAGDEGGAGQARDEGGAGRARRLGCAPGPPARQTCFRPGFPASLTNDAAVVSGAFGVVTAETVL